MTRSRAALWTMIAAYAAVFVFLSLVKYRNYLYTDFDLAIFAQAVDRLMHGSTWSSIRGMDWRGDHASWILYPIAPLTWPFPGAAALVVLQSVVLALGAVPVHRMGRRALGEGWPALLCAGLYLMYPAVGYSNLFEFHPEVLCTTTLLVTIEAMLGGDRARALVFAAISLLGKEDMALAVLGVAGLGLLLRPRRVGIALAMGFMATISLGVMFLWVRPMLGHGESDYAQLYSTWGRSPAEAAANVLRHPWDALSALWSTPGNGLDTVAKRQLYLHLLLPLGFLPLLAPLALLPALPILAEHLLSSRASQHAIVHHYTVALTPFFVTATVLGLRNAREWSARLRLGPAAFGAIGAAALVASLLSNLAFGPVLGHQRFQLVRATQRIWPDAKASAMRPYRDRMVGSIPPEGGVVASFEYLPRLAARPDVHSYHHVYSGRYTMSEKPYPSPTGVHALLSTFGNEYDEAAAQRLRDLIVTNDLHPVDAIDDLLLYRKAPSDTVELLRVTARAAQDSIRVVYDGQLAFLGCDLDEASASRGRPIELRTYWQRLGEVDRVFLTLFRLVDVNNRDALYRPRYLGYGLSTVDRWPTGPILRETYRLLLPRSLAPGRYRLVLQVATRRGLGSGLAQPDDPRLAAAGGDIQLGVLEVR